MAAITGDGIEDLTKRSKQIGGAASDGRAGAGAATWRSENGRTRRPRSGSSAMIEPRPSATPSLAAAASSVST
jgi:hypothetical protein